MTQEISLTLSPEEAADENLLLSLAASKLDISPTEIMHLRIVKQSIDARKGKVKINLKLLIFVNEPAPKTVLREFNFQNVSQKPEIAIIGAGPAGLFAALQLIERGFKPVIFERGKNVQERKIDIAQLHKNQALNADSNYCFGEGGAGTFSDGKLFTRSTKRGDISKILELLVFHGADSSILFEAHPHIGSDKLPVIIRNIRKTILDCGGEILFNQRVTDFVIEKQKIKYLIFANGEKFSVQKVILATGHSATDIYELLSAKNILLENKSFAVGVRVEHPQSLINAIQYHTKEKNPFLPAANYNLVTQVENRGVYSFCMCPGGIVVPAATGINEIVVNGMSSSHRSSEFANSGIVVEIRVEDTKDFQEFGDLSGFKFQKHLEKMTFHNGGGGLIAPAQRLSDFVKGRLSSSLPKTSYSIGLVSSPLHFWFPEGISQRLRQGFQHFEQKMNGFLTNEAVVIGMESRTSSPIRIPRNENFTHLQIENLYPCGEGAGYSGGIVSSAIDGMLCAEKISL